MDQTVPGRRILRFVTALLLVLIAFDLAAVHTCAFDTHTFPGTARTSMSSPNPAGSSGHPDAVLHPDHCFCHGLSIGADSSVLAEPFHRVGSVPETPPGHLLQVPSALYHPPQLLA